MICPKCGFEQPDGVECMRCGIIVSRYKGLVAGAGPGDTPPPFAPGAIPPPPLPSPFMPPPPVIAGGSVHAPIPLPPHLLLPDTVLGEPAKTAGGTVYGGGPPPPAGGGSVYGGPGTVAPTFSSFGAGFYGTFETGKVLGETFSTFFSNFLPFVMINALVSLPVMALAFYVVSLKDNPQLAALVFLGTILLQMICTQVAAGGITYGVYQQMRGRSPSVGDCLQVGLSRLIPVIAVAIVTVFAVGLGLVLCVIPAFIVLTMLAVVIPVTVEERPGLIESLRRSAYLTESFRWRIFGVLFVLGIIQQIPVRMAVSTVHDLGTLLLITVFLGILTTGLQATAAAVMYYRLRSVKESIDVDQISSVFS
jgi:hypothetical protein